MAVVVPWLSLGQIVLHLGIVGIEFQGLLEVGHGLVHPTLLEKHNPKVIVGLKVVGVEFQGLLELDHCLVHLLFCKSALPRLL